MVEIGGGHAWFTSGDFFRIFQIVEKWNNGGVDDADLQYVSDWLKETENDLFNLPDGTEWTPGFDDYNSVIMEFGWDGNGPKRKSPVVL